MKKSFLPARHRSFNSSQVIGAWSFFGTLTLRTGAVAGSGMALVVALFLSSSDLEARSWEAEPLATGLITEAWFDAAGPAPGNLVLAADFEDQVAFDFSRISPVDACWSYCDSMEGVCRTEGTETAGDCMAFCKNDLVALPAGGASDLDVNSLSCRENWISAAEISADPALECSYTHASGGDQCGSWCENYCSLAMNVCSTSNPDYLATFPGDPAMAQDLFSDLASCMDACGGSGAFPTDVLPGVSVTDQQFGYGDTVQCRIHHLQAAVLEPNAAFLHCGHASVSSTMQTCSDMAPPNSVNYCEFTMRHCSANGEIFSDADACRAVADTYPSGNFALFTQSSGGHLGCLNYWAISTPYSPAHCVNADPLAGPCQDP